MLDFNNNDTYTKEVVLKNVRLALFNRNALPDDALCAEFLDMSVVFALIEDSIPYRAKYKIIDATDMASLDIHVKEIMDAGVLVLTAGTNAIRLLPSLSISYEEMDEALAVMQKVFCK